jgi:hypothetical protein
MRLKQNNHTLILNYKTLKAQADQPTPMVAPPAFAPPSPARNSGSNGLFRCINRNTYVWLNNGDNFWFFPTIIFRNVVIGFRWRRFGWVYDKINLRRIRSFQCF